MPKTKISEFSATPGNNTDIDGINIAEGCAPSGINDAIRELMAQLKDFQAGTAGDSFNGPVGTTTAAAGAFTTLSASSTVSGAGFSTYLASPPAIGGTAAAAGSFTTLTTSSTVTHNGGTANGVAYLNGSKVLTTGSALTFDGTNFGVGTASYGNAGAINAAIGVPGTTAGGLQLWSTTTASHFVQFGDGTAGDAPYRGAIGYNHTADGLLFYAAAAEGMRLTSTGLGIGTSSPAYPLDVVASSGSVGISLRGRSSDNIGTFSFFTNNGATNDAQIQMRPSDNEFRILVSGSRSQTFYTNGSERMRLDSSGNLGLGVTPSAWVSPDKVIQFGNGNASIGTQYSGDANFMHNAYESSAGTFKYVASGSGALRYQLDINNNVHKWYYAPSGTADNTITFTQAMTLDASGNLLVGTTNTSASTGSGLKFINDGNGANSPQVAIVTAASGSTTSSLSIYSTGAAAYRFYVVDSGTIYATSNTITAISDQRLKENIQDIDAGLNAVMALKPRKFDWKAGKGKDIKGDRGWIAQEFEQVFPDMVQEWLDPAPEGEEPYKAVNADLIPVLVKAMQEQQVMINELKAEVAALKAK